MSKQVSPESEVVTIETVFKAIQHWRRNKDAYPRRAIPDEVWKKVFILAGQGEHSPASLRQLFTLNSQQYNRKYQALMEKTIPKLWQAFTNCVKLLAQFRHIHYDYATRYVHNQSKQWDSNSAKIGTGGTPFMRYLKKHLDETYQLLNG